MTNNARFAIDRASLQNRGFYQLLLYAAMVGGVVGAITALFLEILHWLEHFIWTEIMHLLPGLGALPFFTLIVAVVGGLLVGLCVHFFGEYPLELKEALEEFRVQGRFDEAHVWQGVVTALVSLGFGASLGPEAALVGLAGGLGSLAARFIKASGQQAYAVSYFSISSALGAFFHSPLGGAALPVEAPDEADLPSGWMFVAGSLAGLAGLMVFSWISPGGTFDFIWFPYVPDARQLVVDVLTAVGLALLGGLVGWAYLHLEHFLRGLMAPLFRQKILRGLLGGLGLGLLATFFPLVLFSGQNGIQTIIDQGAQMGAMFLLLTALAKMIATPLCLATGFKGGQFFPLMMSATALGMAVSLLVPAVHPMVSIAAVMGALLGAVMRKPLAVILLLVFLFPQSIWLVMVASTFVGAALPLKAPGAAVEGAS